MGRCDLCNMDKRLIEGTVMKKMDSGGLVMLCNSCWDHVTRPRCGLCGSTDVSRDDAMNTTIAEHNPGGRGAAICSGCRGILDWNNN